MGEEAEGVSMKIIDRDTFLNEETDLKRYALESAAFDHIISRVQVMVTHNCLSLTDR